MSWLYSQALVEEYLGDISLDGEQSVQLSGSNTQLAYCALDKMTGFSRLSRFGMTYKPLTENLGEELLKSYLGAFHVRTFQPQEKVLESQENDQECGERWHGLLAKYNPNTHSWKTAQCSLFEDLELSLETWPKWGLMQDGVCWEQTPLVLPINETVYGFSLPTPVASDGTSGAVIGKNDLFYTTSTGMPRKVNQNGKDGSVGLGRLVQMWPTPRSCSAMAATITQESAWNKKRKANLETIVGQRLWPTPDANCGMRATQELWTPKRKSGHQAQYSINQAVRDSFATPTARMWKDNGTSPAELNRNSETLAVQAGGNLNPMWVEWLMGWPLGWTDLKQLEMDKSPCVQQPHGNS